MNLVLNASITNLTINPILYQKYISLKKCIWLDILLPSNDKKGIDFNLLLIQQKRNIYKHLKEINDKPKDDNYYLLCIILISCHTTRNTRKARKAITKLKFRYKRKNSWLSNKQKEVKKSCLLNVIKFYPKRKSIKNKKDRKRYLIRKKSIKWNYR